MTPRKSGGASADNSPNMHLPSVSLSNLTKTRRSRDGTKNSPSFFSLKYFQENHADVLCTPLILICMATMWSKSQKIAVRFIWPSNTSAFVGYHDAQYGPCKYDAALISFYTIVTVCVHACIKHYLSDRLVKGLRLSWARIFSLNRMIQRVVFESIIVFYAIYVWYYVSEADSDISLSTNTLVSVQPNKQFSIYTKFLFIFDLCYWLHWPLETYFDVYIFPLATKASKWEEISQIMFMSLTHTIVHFLGYLSGYWTLGFMLIFLKCSSCALVNLCKCMDLVSGQSITEVDSQQSRQDQNRSSVFKVVNVIALLWNAVSVLMSFTIVGCNLMVQLKPTNAEHSFGTDEEELMFSNRQRIVLLGFLVGSAPMLIASVYTFLKDLKAFRNQFGKSVGLSKQPTTSSKKVKESESGGGGYAMSTRSKARLSLTKANTSVGDGSSKKTN